MTAYVAAAKLRSMVAVAAKAPSSHNTQPWFFELEPAGIKLFADRTRALATNDPFDRELTISCGAALFNLEIAARSEGYFPDVDLLPDAADPDLLAIVSLGEGAPNGTYESELADLRRAIDRRQTTRGPFDSTAVADDFVESLEQVATQHNVIVHFGLDRDRLADLVAQGDQKQFADPHWRRELASWMQLRRTGDGLVAERGSRFSSKVVVSAEDIGSPRAASDHQLVESAPIVMAIATAADTPEHWIEAGRALQHLLLTATIFDMGAGYLNQSCQVPALRVQLEELMADVGCPQLVLRFGSSDSVDVPTSRRPLGDIIV